MTLQAEIKSKDCKSQKHKSCAGHWTGLGIEVVCECTCHKMIADVRTKTPATEESNLTANENAIQNFNN